MRERLQFTSPEQGREYKRERERLSHLFLSRDRTARFEGDIVCPVRARATPTRFERWRGAHCASRGEYAAVPFALPHHRGAARHRRCRPSSPPRRKHRRRATVPRNLRRSGLRSLNSLILPSSVICLQRAEINSRDGPFF